VGGCGEVNSTLDDLAVVLLIVEVMP